jgi:hypothetical protein
MARSPRLGSVSAPGAVRWAYLQHRWVLVSVRRCAQPGCHFLAVDDEAFCIRCRKQHRAPSSSASVARAEQLSLFGPSEKDDSPKERR